ncbi:MAG: nitrate- and nitrite sensing domain-containing protein [Gammaproteobacteria bacterium]|nr:nitrate- and nitrite sensing domain-containing protein [Gammaproteobacteria bacterium]
MYNAEADMSNLAELHQNQQLRIKALDLVKSLFEQVRVVQQHRAATNAALAGNPFFESKTRVLAREVNARFKELERQQAECVDVIDERQWEDIRNAWQTVHLQWRQDEIIENFELHSHLVKQLLDYISILGNKAEDLIETGSQHQALSHYVLNDVPAFIEMLGQIRALGTSTAVVGVMDDACEMRLRFLMGQLNKQQIKVKQQAQHLSQEALDITSSLIDALLCEPKLERLTGIVMHDLLSGREIVTSADEIFTLSTQIIDAHYNVMNEGLRLLRLSMDRRMQAWVSR